MKILFNTKEQLILIEFEFIETVKKFRDNELTYDVVGHIFGSYPKKYILKITDSRKEAEKTIKKIASSEFYEVNEIIAE